MSSSPAASDLRGDLDLALRLADAAAAVSLARFDAADLTISRKPDHTDVTDADLSTERAIRSILAEERPDDGIFGEEYGATGDLHRQWIIDPIDGTAGFLRGIPLWGNLISLAIDGVPQVGVVGMPALGRRWWAATGLGSWTDAEGGPRRLHVSAIDDIAETTVSFQSIGQWRDAGRLSSLLHIAEKVWRDRGIGDVYSYMLLAEGRLDMVSEFDVKEYDIAAAVPIVREAGGEMTAVDGTSTISDRSVLATNGVLHSAFLDLLRVPQGEEPS